jgi:8-oxo-dGTP pyrophosphatase MutT (NUDIX family)
MADRFLARSAIFVAVLDRDGKVLLQRRAHTGFMDGRYDLPSGHVEKDEPLLEAAVRELKEETDITVRPEDLRLWHVNQFGAQDQYYYNFFFVTDKWQGEPKLTEPEKHDDLQFFALDDLPKMTAGTHVAIPDITSERVTFGYIDQEVFEEISK